MALASWGTCRCARSQMKIISRLVNIQMMPLQSCESIELQFYNLFLLFSHDVVSLMYNINGGGQFPVRYVMLVCLCFLPAFVTKELDRSSDVITELQEDCSAPNHWFQIS